MLKNHVVAAFDFDGTITQKDTLFDFLKFYKGKPKLFLGMIAVSPYLILYSLGIMTNEEAKEKLLAFFLKNHTKQELDEVAQQYKERIEQICYSETLERIEWHKSKGHEVLIISASPRFWIEPWAKSKGIETVLATEVEVKNEILTGKFASPNCYGQEKVNRLKTLYPQKDFLLYAYGDSAGDKELLAMADFPTLYKRK